MDETKSNPGVKTSEFWMGGGIAAAMTQADPVYAWPLAAIAIGYAIARAMSKMSGARA